MVILLFFLEIIICTLDDVLIFFKNLTNCIYFNDALPKVGNLIKFLLYLGMRILDEIKFLHF